MQAGWSMASAMSESESRVGQRNQWLVGAGARSNSAAEAKSRVYSVLGVSVKVAVRQALLGPAVGRKERNNRALANERRRSAVL